MPIKLNLLAEAKIAEDLRRRDPVKRAVFAGAFLVVLMLVWSSSLQLELVIKKSELTQVQSQIQSRTNEWQAVLDSQKKIADCRARVVALQQLGSGRFLQGNMLNALQKLNFDGVQLASVRVKQSYLLSQPSSDDSGKANAATRRPATVTEKIAMSIDARDISASPGDQVNRFKDSVASQDYFKSILSKTNGVQLTSLSPLQTGPDGKAFELFTLECTLPQQNR